MLDELCQGDKPALTLKDELLRHYASCKPVLFMQFDGFAQVHPCDNVMIADEAGHCVTWGEAYELRRLDIPVRVQIRSGTSGAEAVALLKKILAGVQAVVAEEGDSAFELSERPHLPSAAAFDDPDLDGFPF